MNRRSRERRKVLGGNVGAARGIVLFGLSNRTGAPRCLPVPVPALHGANSPRGIHRWLNRRGTSPCQVLERRDITGAPGGLPDSTRSSREVIRKGTGISQQRDDGRVCGHRRAQLRLGAGSRPAALERPGRGAGRGVCQPAADSRRARATTAASARRATKNGPTRISTRPAECAASICAGIPTS